MPNEINPYIPWATPGCHTDFPLLHYTIVSSQCTMNKGTIHINQVRSKSSVIYTENPPLSPSLQRESVNKSLSRQLRAVPLISFSRLERNLQEWPLQGASSFNLPNSGLKESTAIRSMCQRAPMPSHLSMLEDQKQTHMPQNMGSLIQQIFVEYEYLPRGGQTLGKQRWIKPYHFPPGFHTVATHKPKHACESGWY